MNEENSAISIPGKTIGLTLGILAIGIVGLVILLSLRPEAKRVEPGASAAPVKVVTIHKLKSRNLRIETYGTVEAAHQVDLKAQVSGLISYTAPALRPGSIIEAGTVIAEIEADDYEQAVIQAKSKVLSAEAALELEQGQQVVAKEEFEFLDESLKSASTKLRALRKPQLKEKQANLQAAKSQLEQAQKNLERTKLVAPFDALVLDESLEVGQLVTGQTTLATLVDTREFYVRAELPIEKMHYIPADAEASITVGQNSVQASVLGPVGSLDPRSRLAQMLIAIKDPLQKNANILLGDYLSVTIEAKPLINVYQIPRTALRADNTVWTVRSDKLIVTPIVPVFSKPETLFVRGELKETEQLVVSAIPVMKPEMPVSIIDE